MTLTNSARTRREWTPSHRPIQRNRPEPALWHGAFVFDAHHDFSPWDAVSTQCGRCWGWADDWRHLGVRATR